MILNGNLAKSKASEPSPERLRRAMDSTGFLVSGSVGGSTHRWPKVPGIRNVGQAVGLGWSVAYPQLQRLTRLAIAATPIVGLFQNARPRTDSPTLLRCDGLTSADYGWQPLLGW